MKFNTRSGCSSVRPDAGGLRPSCLGGEATRAYSKGGDTMLCLQFSADTGGM